MTIKTLFWILGLVIVGLIALDWWSHAAADICGPTYGGGQICSGSTPYTPPPSTTTTTCTPGPGGTVICTTTR